MTHARFAILGLAAACAALAACGDDDPAPTVSIETVAPEQLTPDDDLLDDLTLTVRYADADGDLGGGVAEIHDCRSDAVVVELAIPAIAPAAVVADGIAITGTLVLEVTDVGHLAPAAPPAACDALGVPALAAGEVIFCVTLVDAAGHRGPGDCTGSIALLDP